MLPEQVRLMSVEEFLTFAESSEDRYEYIDGEPRKMTGGKLNHFRIATKILILLQARLANMNCEAISSGMLIKSGEARFVAPDVSVVCGQAETEADTRLLLNPVLVVEVTSPSSAKYDRGAKRDFYFDVPSIDALLIVDQHRALVELNARSEYGWETQRFSHLADDVPLECLDCNLPLRDIYRGIDFDEETRSTPAEGR